VLTRHALSDTAPPQRRPQQYHPLGVHGQTDTPASSAWARRRAQHPQRLQLLQSTAGFREGQAEDALKVGGPDLGAAETVGANRAGPGNGKT
jgi:hypothetical protein